MHCSKSKMYRTLCLWRHLLHKLGDIHISHHIYMFLVYYVYVYCYKDYYDDDDDMANDRLGEFLKNVNVRSILG